MKKFHKADALELSVLKDCLKKGNAHLEEQHKILLDGLEKLFEPFTQAIKEQNHNIEMFNEFLDARIEDIENYIGEKSERWQESDNGNRYAEWRDKIEGFRIEEIPEIDMPEIEHEDIDVPDDFPLQLPED